MAFLTVPRNTLPHVTADYDDLSISTAKIIDNAITLEKMEDLTQGSVLIYGAAGAPTELGAGSADEVLTSQGAAANPIWGPSQLNWTLIEDFTLISTAHGSYLESATFTARQILKVVLELTTTHSSGGSTVDIRINNDAGATYSDWVLAAGITRTTTRTSMRVGQMAPLTTTRITLIGQGDSDNNGMAFSALGSYDGQVANSMFLGGSFSKGVLSTTSIAVSVVDQTGNFSGTMRIYYWNPSG